MRFLIVRNNGLFLRENRDENRTLFLWSTREEICVLARKEGKRFSLYKGDKLSLIQLVPVELRSNNEIERGERKGWNIS